MKFHLALDNGQGIGGFRMWSGRCRRHAHKHATTRRSWGHTLIATKVGRRGRTNPEVYRITADGWTREV